MKVLQEIIRAKSTIDNEIPEKFERLAARLERSIDQLESINE